MQEVASDLGRTRPDEPPAARRRRQRQDAGRRVRRAADGRLAMPGRDHGADGDLRPAALRSLLAPAGGQPRADHVLRRRATERRTARRSSNARSWRNRPRHRYAVGAGTDVEFSAIGLLVIDEQHRYSVKAAGRASTARTRRSACRTASALLSATPIPRTLSLAYLGISTVDAARAPPGRKPIGPTLPRRSRPEVVRIPGEET